MFLYHDYTGYYVLLKKVIGLNHVFKAAFTKDSPESRGALSGASVGIPGAFQGYTLP
jgi:hypothetical protein